MTTAPEVVSPLLSALSLNCLQPTGSTRIRKGLIRKPANHRRNRQSSAAYSMCTANRRIIGPPGWRLFSIIPYPAGGSKSDGRHHLKRVKPASGPHRRRRRRPPPRSPPLRRGGSGLELGEGDLPNPSPRIFILDMPCKERYFRLKIRAWVQQLGSLD